MICVFYDSLLKEEWIFFLLFRYDRGNSLISNKFFLLNYQLLLILFGIYTYGLLFEKFDNRWFKRINDLVY